MKSEDTESEKVQAAASPPGVVVLPPRPEPEAQRGFIRRHLQHLKDDVLEAIIERMVKKRLAPFGELKHCEVDTHANSIAGQVLMRGDSTPIRVKIDRYEVIDVEGQHFIELKRFSSSK